MQESIISRGRSGTLVKTGILVLICISLSGSLLQAQSTEFYRSLLQKKYASFGDALKAVDILLDGKLEEQSYDQRFNTLQQKGIIPSDWKEKKQTDGLQRGELAYLIVEALEIEGGLIMRIFGTTERYAYRELTYIGIMAGGETTRLVHGEELVSVLRASSEYRNSN